MQATEQQVFWVSKSRRVDLPVKPSRIWTLLDDAQRAPVLPITPQQGLNAFLETERESWRWYAGRDGFGWIIFRSRVRTDSVWILCEYDHA